jgi:hypothetical protein
MPLFDRNPYAISGVSHRALVAGALAIVAATARISSRAKKTMEGIMKRILLAALITSFAVGSAMAQSCESQAVSKEGKPLTGAAKTSFIKKCKVDACATKAVSKDGKPLSGAAKNSFMKKCAKEA